MNATSKTTTGLSAAIAAAALFLIWQGWRRRAR